MGLPKSRMSQSRTGHRRSQWKATLPALVECPNPACGKPKRPHAACGYCGYYNGVQVEQIKKEPKKGR